MDRNENEELGIAKRPGDAIKKNWEPVIKGSNTSIKGPHVTTKRVFWSRPLETNHELTLQQNVKWLG